MSEKFIWNFFLYVRWDIYEKVRRKFVRLDSWLEPVFSFSLLLSSVDSTVSVGTIKPHKQWTNLCGFSSFPQTNNSFRFTEFSWKIHRKSCAIENELSHKAFKEKSSIRKSWNLQQENPKKFDAHVGKWRENFSWKLENSTPLEFSLVILIFD